MLARVVNPTAAAAVKRALVTSNIRIVDSRRQKSHGGEIQHADHHGEVHHHGHDDHYKVLYERLWQHKATLDWLPKPEGNWQEANAKKQAYYNRVFFIGLAGFVFSLYYVKAVICGQVGALSRAPYHLIGNEDFPGSKYEDAKGQ